MWLPSLLSTVYFDMYCFYITNDCGSRGQTFRCYIFVTQPSTDVAMKPFLHHERYSQNGPNHFILFIYSGQCTLMNNLTVT